MNRSTFHPQANRVRYKYPAQERITQNHLSDDGEDDFASSNFSENALLQESKHSNHVIVLSLAIPIALQILIILALLFILTYYFSKSQSCSNNKEIWCKDDWYCNKQTGSTDTMYNKCFRKKEKLASCLFGPTSDAAVKCLDFSKKGVACDCVIPKGSKDVRGSNCLAGCPNSLKGVGKDTICCCDPKNEDCPYETLPPECQRR